MRRNYQFEPPPEHPDGAAIGDVATVEVLHAKSVLHEWMRTSAFNIGEGNVLHLMASAINQAGFNIEITNTEKEGAE